MTRTEFDHVAVLGRRRCGEAVHTMQTTTTSAVKVDLATKQKELLLFPTGIKKSCVDNQTNREKKLCS